MRIGPRTWVLLLLSWSCVTPAACSRKGEEISSDREERPRAKKKTPKKTLDDDPDELAKNEDKVFTASIEGAAVSFPFGKAYAGYNGLHVVLSNEKLACATYDPPSDDAYQVEFDLAPGPAGAFFAGRSIGVAATINSQRFKLKMPWIGPHLVKTLVQPFKLKEGERLHGSLNFASRFDEIKADTSKKTYEYKGAGTFDVEICEDYNHFKALAGQPSTSGGGDVAGTFASEPFVYKTALVNVLHDNPNAQDYIESVEFYPVVDVDCTSRWDQWNKSKMFVVRSVGGTGSKLRLAEKGSPQPADPSFTIPTYSPVSKTVIGMLHAFGGGGHRAWITFERLEFEGGHTLSGEVYADSTPDAKPPDVGKIGGKFTAKVCAVR